MDMSISYLIYTRDVNQPNKFQNDPKLLEINEDTYPKPYGVVGDLIPGREMFSLLNGKKNEQGVHVPPLFPLRPPKIKTTKANPPEVKKSKRGATMTILVSATWTGRMDEEAHARGVPARL